MAIKLEVTGNSFIITDTVTGLEVFETAKRSIYYDVRKLNNDDSIVITKINDFVSVRGQNSLYEMPLSDSQNAAGQAFSKVTLKAFFRTNIGA
tara:strand:- start:1455 stop:1733 length:279 start_codon:yes stop_codon:yes gene_type:complete